MEVPLVRDKRVENRKTSASSSVSAPSQVMIVVDNLGFFNDVTSFSRDGHKSELRECRHLIITLIAINCPRQQRWQILVDFP